MRHEATEKFTCPGCGEKCVGRICWNAFRHELFYRYRRCEKCGIMFVTSERVQGISQKSRRRRIG